MSQQELAGMIGVHRNTIVSWEQGDTLPKSRSRMASLVDAFHLDKREAEEFFRVAFFSPGADSLTESGPCDSSPLPLFWNVPYRRNPFFTGREGVLSQLYEHFHTERAASSPLQAICGLGGIGKTQTAVEYAYRFRNDYQAVFWVRAETPDLSSADFVSIAELLNILGREERDQRCILERVKRWLVMHKRWLLIVDNVESMKSALDILPCEGTGHTILTTRTQLTGPIAVRIDLEPMAPEEGTLFLLRRAKQIAYDARLEEAPLSERHTAQRIVSLMDGLPLALDQAGAYIEETECSLADYLDRYQYQRDRLLTFRGESSIDHPHSVSATFSYSFEKIEQASSAAADLLRLCTFFYPDAIPEEMITEAATELGPHLGPAVADPYNWDTTLAMLRTYSLVHRHPDTKTLTIHRLVQASLRDQMEKSIQDLWIERAIRVVNHFFPEVRELVTWERCRRCLPHARVCNELVEQRNIISAEAGRLLYQTGIYLTELGQYTQAEPFLVKGYSILSCALGPEHPEVAASLHGWGSLYEDLGKYDQAETLYLKALDMRKKTLGVEHLSVAEGFNDLAVLARKGAKYARAEQFHLRALHIREKILGSEHLVVTESLNNLAVLYLYQEKYEQAESLFQHVLGIREKILGPEHPYVAHTLDKLAELSHYQADYERAELLYQRSLAIRETALGREHKHVAVSLNGLAMLYSTQKKYAQAELFFLRALSIYEKAVGPDYIEVAIVLTNLAKLSMNEGKSTHALSLYQRALSISEKTLGPAHPKTISLLCLLAQFYYTHEQYTQAETFYQRLLHVPAKLLKKEYEAIAALEDYVDLLSTTQREGEAIALQKRLKRAKAQRKSQP